MRNQNLHGYKWMVPLLILVVVGVGCSGGPMETVVPSIEPSSTVPVAPKNTEASSPTPTEVPVLSPTTTPTPAPESSAHENEHVLYEDDFTTLEGGWAAQVFDNFYVGYHEPEWYHVEVKAPYDDALVTLPDQLFEDFTSEVEVFVEEPLTEQTGDFRYGLVFRRLGKQWYALTISPHTQEWWVLKSSPSGLEVLKEGSEDTIQGIGTTDTLRVDAKGSTFYFHINDQLVTQVSDPDYASGEVGFFVENFDNPKTHIHYDFLSIRDVQAPQLQCVVTTQAIHLRAGPGTVNAPLTALRLGTNFEPLGRSSDDLWVEARVEGSGQLGWVSNSPKFFSCNLLVADLPVSE